MTSIQYFIRFYACDRSALNLSLSIDYPESFILEKSETRIIVIRFPSSSVMVSSVAELTHSYFVIPDIIGRVDNAMK